MVQEIWMEIKGQDGCYKISSTQTVISVGRNGNGYKDRVIKFSINEGGYLQGAFSIKNKRKNVLHHRLMAISFIPNPNNLPDINHLNGIKTDNRIENLEWCTKKENCDHAIATGLSKIRGEDSYQSVLKNHQVIEIINSKLSCKELGDTYGVTPEAVGLIRSGKNWSHLTGIKYSKKEKFSEQDLVDIKKSTESRTLLAKKYNVCPHTITNIRKGHTHSK